MCTINITPLNLGKCGTAVLVQIWTAVIFLDQYTNIVRQSALEPGRDPWMSRVFLALVSGDFGSCARLVTRYQSG